MFSWNKIGKLNRLSPANLELFYEGMTRNQIKNYEILDLLRDMHPCLKEKALKYIRQLHESATNVLTIEGIPPPSGIRSDKELLKDKQLSQGSLPINITEKERTEKSC